MDKIKVEYDPNYPDLPGDMTQKELIATDPEGELCYRQSRDKHPEYNRTRREWANAPIVHAMDPVQ